VGHSRNSEERIRLKDERFLLFKRQNTLNLTEIDRISEWLNAFPILEKVYEVKARFSAVYDCPNRRTATIAINKCIQSIPIARRTLPGVDLGRRNLEAAHPELLRRPGNERLYRKHQRGHPAVGSHRVRLQL